MEAIFWLLLGAIIATSFWVPIYERILNQHDKEWRHRKGWGQLKPGDHS